MYKTHCPMVPKPLHDFLSYLDLVYWWWEVCLYLQVRSFDKEQVFVWIKVIEHNVTLVELVEVPGEQVGLLRWRCRRLVVSIPVEEHTLLDVSDVGCSGIYRTEVRIHSRGVTWYGVVLFHRSLNIPDSRRPQDEEVDLRSVDRKISEDGSIREVNTL